jgi:hypothetical protein
MKTPELKSRLPFPVFLQPPDLAVDEIVRIAAHAK